MAFGDSLGKANDIVNAKIQSWLEHPTDFHEVSEAFDNLGELKALVIRLKRKIAKAEDDVIIDEDKPRSNDAKKRRIAATSRLLDDLAEAEAELAKVDALTKKLEHQKAMYTTSSYAVKVRLDT